jgi:hypothetical protein
MCLHPIRRQSLKPQDIMGVSKQHTHHMCMNERIQETHRFLFVLLLSILANHLDELKQSIFSDCFLT